MRVSEMRFYLHFSSVNLQRLTKVPFNTPPAITTNNRFYIVNISSNICYMRLISSKTLPIITKRTRDLA